MSAARKVSATLAPLAEVFRARVAAQAHLVAEGELEFLDAVDALQGAAVAYGLVRELGQDEVQRVMAEAFRAVPKPCIVEDVDVVPDPVPEPPEVPKRGTERRAPESTVDALVYALRQRGVAALVEPACRQRLAELSIEQLAHHKHGVIARLMRLRLSLDPRYPAITDDLLFQLGEQIR